MFLKSVLLIPVPLLAISLIAFGARIPHDTRQDCASSIRNYASTICNFLAIYNYYDTVVYGDLLVPEKTPLISLGSRGENFFVTRIVIDTVVNRQRIYRKYHWLYHRRPYSLISSSDSKTYAMPFARTPVQIFHFSDLTALDTYRDLVFEPLQAHSSSLPRVSIPTETTIPYAFTDPTIDKLSQTIMCEDAKSGEALKELELTCWYKTPSEKDTLVKGSPHPYRRSIKIKQATELQAIAKFQAHTGTLW